ncbi:phosphoenolpyruvate mutase [Burkholderia sp. FERM BP-3421]|jgi:phosphoenolpyruvate phosphomutase|uniref:phosphoenolpyruvate mutase n=1 Tax=Burkholderia sp. FERM BP-3421 TaxID=1494466 RepID=UPI002360E3B7|nr:phosphoenolpyruvate mutase [Burkholderia sp. FERM BP-3421]WDD95585.1 phosphoenolpyruvate mutase [Burkholderia sp. FERM BP-3421]
MPIRESANITITNEQRRRSFKDLLEHGRPLRFIESHSPLSAVISENVYVATGGNRIEFDGFWSSSLTDSTLRGLPDIEILDISNRLSNIQHIFDVTTKPLIIDGDTGGKPEHFSLNVQLLERAGVSAVIIEDKTGLKKNSLLGNEVIQYQDSIDNFCDKIRIGKAAQITRDFQIIARIESLILDKGMQDALERAVAYCEAGADGIMIHSRRTSADEVIEFAERFRALGQRAYLVCVPTSFNAISFAELARHFSVVIYANHLLRAAYPAMLSVAEGILAHGRTLEVEPHCLPINEILKLVPGTA